MPAHAVIPATQEAEAGESLDPRKQRLQLAEISSIPPSLGNKSKTPSQKIKVKIKKYSLCLDKHNVSAACKWLFHPLFSMERHFLIVMNEMCVQ